MAVKDEKMAEAGQDELSKKAAALKKRKEAEAKEADLSEEDLELKKNLEMMVERIKDADAGVAAAALAAVTNEIRSATTSMTSVPKPLKFLRAHYAGLVAHYDAGPPSANRAALADVLSVLAITTGKEGERAALKYCLLGANSKTAIGSWGHEYVRAITGQVGEEFAARKAAEQPVDDLMALVEQIVPYHMAHNAEPEAVDLLLEVWRLDLLAQHVDEKNYARTTLYLTSTTSYLAETEDMAVLQCAYDIYLRLAKYPDALRLALRMNSVDLVQRTLGACEDPTQKKQLAYLLGRHGVALDFEAEGPAHVADEALREELAGVASNMKLSELYLALARDLDVMEPKTPEEVYKSHLVDGRQPTGPAVDSARQNLAASFVNGLVNAGFGQDKLMTVTPEGEGAEAVHWIFKNKDHGKMSATASLGLITLWDVEGGLPQIDKYLYSSDQYVEAGALLAVGIVNCRVQHENDPAFALLYEAVNKPQPHVRIGAIMGLGLAYAGTRKEDVQELLAPIVTDTDVPMEVAASAALSLGLVFCSSCHEEAVQSILQAMMMRGEGELGGWEGKQMALGLALLFLGRQDAVEATLEVAKTLSEQVSRYAQVLLEGVAYAGTGDVLRVQQLLALAGEHITPDEAAPWKAAHQAPAVMGIALVALAEELGGTMAHRMLEHLLQYGDAPVRRAVPLALALLNVSNPNMSAMDTLSRLSHDTDADVAQAAIVALGIIGAGTNNARLAGMLRSLSSYYYKEPTALFLVRLAQGLVHAGKGLLTLSPHHTDGQLLSGVGLAGILAVLTAAQDIKATLGGPKHHAQLFYLATALRPRMLVTLDEAGALLPVPVRVGQAVDVVAQAGRPKTVTGFQTHTTPVLLSAGERAELGTQKYLPLTPTLEGVVILKPNPDYVEVAE